MEDDIEEFSNSWIKSNIIFCLLLQYNYKLQLIIKPFAVKSVEEEE